MNILVTGGTGFIGSRLIESFILEPGNTIHFTGRSNPKRTDLLDRGITFHRGDLADENFAKDITKNMNAVIHCAGMAGTWGPYEDYYRANVLGTKFLLDGAKASGVRRFVNISSPSIYFDFKDQFCLKEEEVPKHFSNAYAQTKYESELLVRSYHSDELQTVSLRPRSVIGRGDQNVLPRLIKLQQDGNLVQIGQGANVVDITTIGNLIHAVKLCLKAQSDAMGETYNITNGAPIKFWDFVEDVLRMAGLQTSRRRLPYGPVMLAARINETLNKIRRRKSEPTLLPISVGVISYSMTLDISKAEKKLGYKPVYSTHEGIREFFEE
jgi:2-alkyl-3-oxoalkanoate reductase